MRSNKRAESSKTWGDKPGSKPKELATKKKTTPKKSTSQTTQKIKISVSNNRQQIVIDSQREYTRDRLQRTETNDIVPPFETIPNRYKTNQTKRRLQHQHLINEYFPKRIGKQKKGCQ
jgi:hypothetical protein